MAETFGFLLGIGIGLIVGLLISFLYTQYKVARLTANFQQVAVAYASGKIKDVSLEALKKFMNGKKQDGTEVSLG